MVIPAFQEERRLGPTLDRLAAHFADRGLRGEIIVVDDGSRDATQECVTERLHEMRDLHLVGFSENRGKGAAIATGVAHAAGRFILLYDADAAAPIEELDAFLERARNGEAIVIGSRYAGGGLVARSTARALMGRIYAWLVSRWLLPGIRDSQCGFKLIRRDIAKTLFPELQLSGYAFDVEFLVLARRRGYSVTELPIAWTEVPGSKLRLVRDTTRMLRDTLRIRRLHGRPWFVPRRPQSFEGARSSAHGSPAPPARGSEG